jgi:hypothetical protein
MQGSVSLSCWKWQAIWQSEQEHQPLVWAYKALQYPSQSLKGNFRSSVVQFLNELQQGPNPWLSMNQKAQEQQVQLFTVSRLLCCKPTRSNTPCNTTNIITLAHLHGYLTLLTFDHVQVLSRHWRAWCQLPEWRVKTNIKHCHIWNTGKCTIPYDEHDNTLQYDI